MSKRFSIHALFYGDYLDLAQRCLTAFEPTLHEGAAYITDFRLGLNSVAPPTQRFVVHWAQQVWQSWQIPVHIYVTDKNVFKYPLMRRMFRDPEAPLAQFVMWFDDDSFLTGQPGWWSRVLAAIEGQDMIGQAWFLPIEGNQWNWIQQQPWYNPDAGPPPMQRGRRCFSFCQGAWWVLRSRVVHDYDWPIPSLRHNGGDSLLGELFRHQGLRKGRFDYGVRINADDAGQPSRAARRGHSESVIGKDDRPGATEDLSHHDFELEKILIGSPVTGPRHD